MNTEKNTKDSTGATIPKSHRMAAFAKPQLLIGWRVCNLINCLNTTKYNFLTLADGNRTKLNHPYLGFYVLSLSYWVLAKILYKYLEWEHVDIILFNCR